VKIAYFNKSEREKRVRGGDFRSKFDLNHPSLIDEGKEIKVLMTAHRREGEERGRLSCILIQ